MKKVLCLILCAVLILELTGCQKKEKNPFDVSGNFRSATWGMTRDEVKALETAELIVETDDLFLYRDQVGRYVDVNAGYTFAGNRLIEGSYIFSEDHDDMSLYIEDFNQIKEELRAVYGKPAMEGSDWLNGRKYNVPEDQLGPMVANGDLTYLSRWRVDTTEIVFGLYGKNGQINMILSYSDKEFAPFENSYESDTTGYRPARDYQLYIDSPESYEREFIYIKAKIKELDIGNTFYFYDEDYNSWMGVIPYAISDEEILQGGDEVTLFGQVIGGVQIDDTVTLMIFKIDKDGEVMRVTEPGGVVLEDAFFSWKAMQ